LPETDQQPTAGKPGVSVRALAILAVVAVVVYAFDRVSKFLVTENLTLGDPVPVLGELLQFRYVENPGAAFSLGSGTTWIFAIIASAVAVFIVIFARRIRSAGWAVLFGLLLGGNLGNLTDRLTREPGFGQGHVVDFLQLYAFPAIFNIADVAIVSSMGLFIILTIRGVGLDGRRSPRDTQKADELAGPDPS
jgi:signal peptidase II